MVDKRQRAARAKAPERNAARQRLDLARARRAELQAGLLAGELVRVETVAQLWEQHIITARQRLLQIAHDPELSADARQIVDRLVRAALHELSQYDPRRT